MLNAYCDEFGIDRDTIEEFSDQVNHKNESGSLHPRAPVSAVPRHLIRDDTNSITLAKEIEEFLKVNESKIKSTKLLFDFRAGVAPFVVDACNMALKSPYTNDVDEVVIIHANWA